MAASLTQLSPALYLSYVDLLIRVEELEKTVAEQAKIIDARAKAPKAKDEAIIGLTKKITELELKLLQYENSHTPSSAKRFKEKPKRKDCQKKRGVPKGHGGTIRPTPEPDECVGVFADHYEKCGSTNLKETDADPVIIKDLIRQLRQIKVTEFDRAIYKCLDCSHAFTAKHKAAPRRGGSV
jgi:uncharacterized coiled-coil protein SlyX